MDLKERWATAQVQYRDYRESGGTEDEPLAWLYYHCPDRELFNDLQSSWRFQSSYPVRGGVMFCPQPQKGRGAR